MNVKLVTQLLSQSSTEEICNARAEDGIVYSLWNKKAFTTMSHIYTSVGTTSLIFAMEGAGHIHQKCVSVWQTHLLDILILTGFSAWNKLHDEWVKMKCSTE